jgi:hypothetical protein
MATKIKESRALTQISADPRWQRLNRFYRGVVLVKAAEAFSASLKVDIPPRAAHRHFGRRFLSRLGKIISTTTLVPERFGMFIEQVIDFCIRELGIDPSAFDGDANRHAHKEAR